MSWLRSEGGGSRKVDIKRCNSEKINIFALGVLSWISILSA